MSVVSPEINAITLARTEAPVVPVREIGDITLSDRIQPGSVRDKVSGIVFDESVMNPGMFIALMDGYDRTRDEYFWAGQELTELQERMDSAWRQLDARLASLQSR